MYMSYRKVIVYLQILYLQAYVLLKQIRKVKIELCAAFNFRYVYNVHNYRGLR